LTTDPQRCLYVLDLLMTTTQNGFLV
jgi:hypothetical protein